VPEKLVTLAALCASPAAASDALVLAGPNGAGRFRVIVNRRHIACEVALPGGRPLGIVVGDHSAR
jgi:hypothetical protein